MEQNQNLVVMPLKSAVLRAFELQLKEGVNNYRADFLQTIIHDLIDRDLLEAKLKDFERQLKGKDSFGREIIGELSLKNGWLTSGYNFQNDVVELVEYDGQKMFITWRMHLDDEIEYKQDFQAKMGRKDYEGSINAKLQSVAYFVRLDVRLSTYHVDVMDFYMECKGIENVEIEGLETMHENEAAGILKEAKAVFNEHALDVFDTLLIQAFEAAVHKTKIQSYLPKWNYARDYTQGELHVPEPTISTCEDELQGQKEVIEPNPVSFIKQFLQLGTFGKQLREKMDTYMNLVLHEAGSIIRIQGLRKAKLPVTVLPISYKDFAGNYVKGDLILSNNWVEDLSEVSRYYANGLLKFDDKKILITTRFPIWKILEFEGEFLVKVGGISEQKGKIKGRLRQLIYSLTISADYLDSGVVTLEEFKLKCLGGAEVEDDGLQGTDMVLAIKNITSTEYIKEVLKTAEILLHRSLEDAIANNDVRRFLPKLDYKKVYREEDASISSEKQYFMLCSKTSFQERILAVYNINYFVRTKDVFMSQYINELRVGSRIGLEDNWENFLPDSDRTFNVMDLAGVEKHATLKLMKGTSSGLTTIVYDPTSHSFFIENDEIIVLGKERFWAFRFKYDFSFFVSDKLLGSGTLEGVVKDVENIMKLRLNMTTRRFKVEDYGLHCFREYKMEVKGLTPENQWLQKYVEDEANAVIFGSAFDAVLALRTDILIEAAELRDAKYTLPLWIYKEDYLQIVIRNESDPRRIEKRMKMLRECDISPLNNTDEKHSNYEGGIPYIQNEAEWWYLNKMIKLEVKHYVRSVCSQIYSFFNFHNFWRMKLPSYTSAFNATIQGGKNLKGELKLSEVIAEGLHNIDFGLSSSIDIEGQHVTISSHIKLSSDLKFNSAVEAITEERTQRGTINGTVESLTFTYKVRLNLKPKTTKLEHMRLDCIGGVHIDSNGFDDNARLTEAISDVAKDFFVGPVLDDIERMMHLALQIAIDKTPPINTPEWSYDLDYSKVHKMRSQRERGLYKVCTR